MTRGITEFNGVFTRPQAGNVKEMSVSTAAIKLTFTELTFTELLTIHHCKFLEEL